MWERSPLAARVAALEARREVPFLVEAGGAQIAGRLDLLARDGTTGLVIDYKSNRVTDSTPAEMRDAGYALQEAVYALALLEHGHEEVEVHFAFLDADEAVMRRFTQADAGDLRAPRGRCRRRPRRPARTSRGRASSARIAPCSGCSAPGPTSTPCMPRLTPTSPPASRARVIVRRLTAEYPEAVISLHYEDAWQLLVAVILSAQCTDARVNEVTPKLFARFPTPASVLDSTQEELEELIRPTGFFRNKSRSIRGAAEHLLMYHDGKVPRTTRELVKVPGAGRKTAAVVLGEAYGVAEGIAVDTHCGRISMRLGLTDTTDPIKAERAADGGRAAQALDQLDAPDDRARPRHLPLARAAVLGVHPARHLSRGTGADGGASAAAARAKRGLTARNTCAPPAARWRHGPTRHGALRRPPRPRRPARGRRARRRRACASRGPSSRWRRATGSAATTAACSRRSACCAPTVTGDDEALVDRRRRQLAAIGRYQAFVEEQLAALRGTR